MRTFLWLGWELYKLYRKARGYAKDGTLTGSEIEDIASRAYALFRIAAKRLNE